MQVVGITLQSHQKATERHVGCPENRNNSRSVLQKLDWRSNKKKKFCKCLCCNSVQRYYHQAFYKNKGEGQPPVLFPPCTIIWFLGDHTEMLVSPEPDQEGSKLGSMSGTRAISTTSRRELSSSSFFPARQGAEGNSRHSERNINLFPSWSG